MSRLKEILEVIDAKVVVAIENDYTSVKTAEEAISHIFNLNKDTQELLIAAIQETNEEFGTEIIKFKEQFSRIVHKAELRFNLLSTGDLETYLRKTNSEIILYERCVRIIKSDLKELNKTFLRYGVYNLNEGHPYSFLENLSPNTVKLIWNYCPESPRDDKEFVQVIQKALKKTNSRFCLAVVDKIFDGNQIGHLFAKRIHEKKELKGSLISFIFTSTPGDSEKFNDERDYFIRQIKKGEKGSIDMIEKYTAQNAWVVLFSKFKEAQIKAAHEAFRLCVSDTSNISQILNKADGEGNSPFDTLNSWFKLATEYFSEKEFLNDIVYTIGLAKFHPEGVDNLDVSDDLVNISAHEIFDYNINKKHSPINSGDIFKKGDEYFLLFGQPCDLSMRFEETSITPNRRNSKVAELIKINFEEPKVKYSKKIVITGNDKTETKYIHLNDFNLNGKNKRIKIELSTKRIIYTDFKILDLSMFNSSGKCEISNSTEIVTSLLPRGKEKYYTDLLSKLPKTFQYITSLKDGVENLNFLTSNLDLNLLDFKENRNEDFWFFEVQRCARIRPKFMSKIYQEIIDYKSRIGLDFYDYKSK